jgi:hypothetical protein
MSHPVSVPFSRRAVYSKALLRVRIDVDEQSAACCLAKKVVLVTEGIVFRREVG